MCVSGRLRGGGSRVSGKELAGGVEVEVERKGGGNKGL